ncbi:50S ribosomal protein L22 [candidate division WOR-3 bacterium]|nr:50S ribosomal protein L22 [candidate division WOR-3 bacterium]
MLARACQKYIGVSPKKLKRLSESFKGKDIREAESALKLSPSPSAEWLRRAIHSAASNLKSKLGAEAPKDEDLLITTIKIDSGPVLKRLKPRAMGRADIIRRRTSHITVIVSSEK